jgi:ABC-2 type transport system ATP-binding protein
MSTIIVDKIAKSFGATQAVRDVSFEVRQEKFLVCSVQTDPGKLPPSRDIGYLPPDSGSVTILGGPMTNEKLNQIGYIPEERGLYQDVPLDRCLTISLP